MNDLPKNDGGRKPPELSEIMGSRTRAGGWTRKQLAKWGVPWPPPKGWKKALLEGAAGIFERGGQAAAAAEIAEETVRDLHAKIGELAVANDFLSRKLKPWGGK